jgi:single-strand DNA-binding protein
MANFNRIIIVGNVVRDPEIRHVQSGAAVARFTIAVNRRTKHNESADYIDVVAWDKMAETSANYLKRGMPVLIEGRLAIRSFESKSGEKHKAAEVVMTSMQMLNSAAKDGNSPDIDAETGDDLEAAF